MAHNPSKPITMPKGQRVHWHEELASTNRTAMELAEDGEPGGLWVVADRQTSGRGRMSRKWVSQPGNLFASYLTTFDKPAYELPGISLVAGIAFYDAVDRIFADVKTALPLALKWPNDLNLHGNKLAGILVETTSSPDKKSYPVILGFGLNLKSAPQLGGRVATSLGDHGIDVPRDRVLEFLGQSLDHWFDMWQRGRNMEAVCAGWMERGLPLGSKLKVNGRGDVALEGRFAGLDEQGALLLESSGEIISISFGDVDLVN